jgi:hypothetical protein
MLCYICVEGALTVLKKVCDHPALLSERATKLVLTGELRSLPR